MTDEELREEWKYDDYHHPLNPKWEETGRVHDWRNYISDDIADEWDTFTERQKFLLATQARETARNEEWD